MWQNEFYEIFKQKFEFFKKCGKMEFLEKNEKKKLTSS